MAEQNNMGYPTISEKAWWIIRDKFKASLPAAVSPTYVKSLLSMASDNSANSNIITPMKRLGLIDDDNKPTTLTNEWRIDEKYSQACETMLKSVYPAELLDLFPGKEIDKNSARTWFMSQGVGQAAADKMIALFTLLKSEEIKEKKAAKTPQKSTSSSPKVASKTKSQNETTATPGKEATMDVKNSGSIGNRPNLHIDLQIHISPESTPEQIECIFASMAKHLYGEK